MIKQIAAAAIVAMVAGTSLGQDLMNGQTPEQVLSEYADQMPEVKAFEMPTLNIGDTPPEFDIQYWAKGTPISEFEKGNVYLLDFWATWCGPCKAIMPHLSELQAEHEDDGLRVVGVSIWESGRDENGGRTKLQGEAHAKHVQKFVDANSDRMEYTVASGDEKIENDWMRAAHQNGIPTVMIVDRDGVIGWIGYGTDPSMVDNLEAILDGTQDLEAAKEARLASMREEFAMQSGGDYFQIFADLASKDKEKAAAFGQALTETMFADSPQGLNAVAWTFVENPGWNEDAVSYALKIARRASDLTNNEDPNILDTVAWAQYRTGDAEGAAETERKAIELLGDNQQAVDAFTESLHTFENGDG